MAKKCPQCGLVNWEYDEFCKRCSASLNPQTPPVYKWFVVYCIFMALGYLIVAVMGLVFLFIEPDRDMSAAEAKIMGSVMLIMGLMFFVPYVAAPFLPRQSWVWVLGLVLICIGLTSACCLPASIPLLIFWLKPEMKAFYGRTLKPVPPPPPQWN
jgi:MFS family permease